MKKKYYNGHGGFEIRLYELVDPDRYSVVVVKIEELFNGKFEPLSVAETVLDKELDDYEEAVSWFNYTYHTRA